MLTNEELKKRLRGIEGVQEVLVEGDGYHYELTIVSDLFLGLAKIKRQQWVYAQLKNEITSGTLHALSMKTWTVNEWEKQHG
jgi:acid stress-induced BolA-like protein IbaG/YrbA